MSTATAEPVTQPAPKGMISTMAAAFDAAGELKVNKPIIENNTQVIPDDPKKGLLDTIDTPVPEETKVDHRKLTAAQWKEVNADRDRLKAELAAAQKKEQEYVVSIKDLDSYKTKAQRADELAEKLALKDYESTPDYQENFAAPRDAKLAQAREFVKELGLPEDLADRMAAATPGGRVKLLDEFVESTGAQTSLGNMIDKYQDLSLQAKAELAKWKGKAASMTEQERLQATNAQERQRKEIIEAFEAGLPELAEKLPAFRKNGDAAHDKQVDENIAQVRSIHLGEATNKDLAMVPAMAIQTKAALARLAASEKENKALKERLAQFADADPKVGSGSSEHDKGDGKPKGMMEWAKQTHRYQ